MDKNRKFHELAGLCWHDPRTYLSETQAMIQCQLCGSRDYSNPNYADDPRLVLEAMRKREDWREFSQLIGLWHWVGDGIPAELLIDIDLILDRSGKLRDLGIEFLERRR